MSWLQVVILAIIEGLSEFLPISSTGHLIIGSSVMGIAGQDFTKLFNVHIQFGTILSVVVLYYKRFLQSFQFYLKLFVGFLPAAIIGLLVKDYIDALLENVMVVALMLLVGGVVLVFIDRLFNHAQDDIDQLTYLKALVIGFFQVLAMVPGVSRSAATIIGGQVQKLSRKAAAEFSFFLAVPTMFAAGAYKLYDDFLGKEEASLSSEQIWQLVAGNVIGFLVAMLAIKFFIGFLTRHGFKLFGYYRIAIGLLILILMASGVELKMV